MNGPTDWKSVFGNSTIPKSCCTEFDSDVCDLAHAHRNGCMPTLLEFLQSKALILGGVGVGIAFIQVLLISFFNRAY